MGRIKDSKTINSALNTIKKDSLNLLPDLEESLLYLIARKNHKILYHKIIEIFEKNPNSKEEITCILKLVDSEHLNKSIKKMINVVPSKNSKSTLLSHE